MVIHILDYNLGVTKIIEDEDSKVVKDVEHYLFDVLKYKESEISYMVTESLDLDIITL